MATVNTTLTVTTSDATTDRLSISVSDALTTGNPAVNIGRLSIGTSAATNILTTSNTDVTYIYLKNTDSTNYVDVKTDAGTDFAELSAGEFLIMPVKGAVGIELQADTSACIVEYGYWTKA